MDPFTQFAEFLKEYGPYAVASIALGAVVVLWRALRKSEQARYELALKIAPLADKLATMIANAARRRRNTSYPRLEASEPESDSSSITPKDGTPAFTEEKDHDT